MPTKVKVERRLRTHLYFPLFTFVKDGVFIGVMVALVCSRSTSSASFFFSVSAICQLRMRLKREKKNKKTPHHRLLSSVLFETHKKNPQAIIVSFFFMFVMCVLLFRIHCK